MASFLPKSTILLRRWIWEEKVVIIIPDLSLFVAAVSFSTNAQIKTPAPSPFQKIEQKVGLTDVTLEYSRPGVKGRTIFGDLVPFDKIWRTGANEATEIIFFKDV